MNHIGVIYNSERIFLNTEWKEAQNTSFQKPEKRHTLSVSLAADNQDQ